MQCCQELYHESVVGPTAEFHPALLVVKREPSDIDFASTLEDAWRHVVAGTVVPDNNVGLKRVVESFVSASKVSEKCVVY